MSYLIGSILIGQLESLKLNIILKTSLSGFNEFEHCLDMDNVDVANDKFQLQSSNDDGACITNLSINNNQVSFNNLISD